MDRTNFHFTGEILYAEWQLNHKLNTLDKITANAQEILGQPDRDDDKSRGWSKVCDYDQ